MMAKLVEYLGHLKNFLAAVLYDIREKLETNEIAKFDVNPFLLYINIYTYIFCDYTHNFARNSYLSWIQQNYSRLFATRNKTHHICHRHILFRLQQICSLCSFRVCHDCVCRSISQHERAGTIVLHYVLRALQPGRW